VLINSTFPLMHARVIEEKVTGGVMVMVGWWPAAGAEAQTSSSDEGNGREATGQYLRK